MQCGSAGYFYLSAATYWSCPLFVPTEIIYSPKIILKKLILSCRKWSETVPVLKSVRARMGYLLMKKTAKFFARCHKTNPLALRLLSL